MARELQSLFAEIAGAKNQLQLQETAIAQIAHYFAAKRHRLFLIDRLPQKVKKSPIFQAALSLDCNPVLKYVFENHIPVHEGVVLTAEKWRAICPRLDHAHVMMGPIVNNGKLIGGLAFTRDRENRPFNSQNLLDLSALCLHVSIQLIEIESDRIKLPAHSLQKITPRELEIAQLVAQGLTNKEIGKILWITENSVKQALKRMFRKLHVSSRAEAIAKLTSINLDRDVVNQ